jgi:hypothetical protein
MARRVNLDAMIRREDFAREIQGEAPPETIRELTLEHLKVGSPIRRLLRKPDFQRETNHWSPDQVLKFLTSFLDGDVIPSVILWRSSNFVFVIDGSHRLSALCAWLEDDYGDRNTSKAFYDDQIPAEQARIAKQIRGLVNKNIGTFSLLDQQIGKASTNVAGKRAAQMFTRPIYLQTVSGTAKAAEDSFFAINQQGTILDETEELLIRNRRKPVAIGARAIVRAGLGHRYWSSFSARNQTQVEALAGDLHTTIFVPQAPSPLKTLDLPLGGSSSPVDALSVLVDFLVVVNNTSKDKTNPASSYPDDESGEETIAVLKNARKIVNRMTGNVPESLGLHPAVYFTNDKGKHNRFLFLGMAAVVTDKLRNNDSAWFRKFTLARKAIERFLIDHKSFIGIVLQNLNKRTRVFKMRDMFNFLVGQANAGHQLEPAGVARHLGLTARVYDLTMQPTASGFSDDTKSQIAYRTQIEMIARCPICGGCLDVSKSVSYDHITRVEDGGLGHASNGQLVHHYCNTGMKN